MPQVAIVDSGLCNIDSIRRAVEECGGTPTIAHDPGDLDRADQVILPGVGAFPDAMRGLTERNLDKALHDAVIDGGIPFLGICLGMQLLAAVGFEGEPTPGLGWIDAEVRRLEPKSSAERVPHVGWNEVTSRGDCPLFDGIADGADFYFVHSFHVACRQLDDIAASTPYCGEFTSVVQRGLVFGVQFHPEKSQRNGFALLRNFIGL